MQVKSIIKLRESPKRAEELNTQLTKYSITWYMRILKKLTAELKRIVSLSCVQKELKENVD